MKDIKNRNDWFEELTPEQKIKINQGLRDLDAGNSISNEEMREKLNTFFVKNIL